MLKKLLIRVEELGVHHTNHGRNLIAFSGGVDSSVVAAAVQKVFPQNSVCIIGRSPSLPSKQYQLAQDVAKHIGISIREVFTKEYEDLTYIHNQGQSCYVCKTHLYRALEAVYAEVKAEQIATSTELCSKVVLFNGTNKDDLQDVTRVGLQAAKEFHVASPLESFSKAEVRQLARELDLPNHAHAASPCLRSRLAMGVHATTENLRRIELAEEVVKQSVALEVQHNLRVRHLKGNQARIELDQEILEKYADHLPILAQSISALGFAQVSFGSYKYGAVSKVL